jgi:hypothetical protein
MRKPNIKENTVNIAGLINTIDEKTRKLQECYFEVISSEASYLRSLNVLISNFVNAEEFQPKRKLSVITSGERKHLFSNIMSIRICSEQFLKQLEARLEDNLVIYDVCDILSEHLEKRFNSYVSLSINISVFQY